MKSSLCLLAILAIFYLGCSKGPDPNNLDKVSIISIAPSSGPAGTTVVIKGTHFGDDPSDNIVRFNNDSAAVLSSSDDSLVVIAPAKGTTGPVPVHPGSSLRAPVRSRDPGS